jgi:hypothetical protein
MTHRILTAMTVNLENHISLQTPNQILMFENEIEIISLARDAFEDIVEKVSLPITLVALTNWDDMERSFALLQNSGLVPHSLLSAVIVDFEGGLPDVIDCGTIINPYDLREKNSSSYIAGRLSMPEGENYRPPQQASYGAKKAAACVVEQILGKPMYALAELRKMNGGEQPQIPIIGSSARTLTKAQTEFLSERGITYVEKPYRDPCELAYHCFPAIFAQEIASLRRR